MIDPAFWAQQRVLVTGHTGFKGSWLTLWLERLGAEVFGLAKAPATKPSLFAEAGVGATMTSIEGDIIDPKAVVAAIDAARPTVVLHLAAKAIVRESHLNPVETFATNVVGTASVLDGARRAPDLRAIVSVTSDKCYENNEWIWGYREDEPMGGHDPYSASKGCAELVTSAMRRSYFEDEGSASVGSARAGNVVGGGDWAADRLIPDIIRAWSVDDEVVIRRPKAVRPWQHVLEPLAGYLQLAQRLANTDDGFDEGWNFGPSEDDTRPVGWIVERMAERWGHGAPWSICDDGGPHEATLLRLDSSKARQQLGWAPQMSLDTAIDWIVDWYRRFYRGESARTLTMDQIDRYQELMSA
ncbi:MAG: CDP-glucose 4,6-dehydratase [Actinomycetia bacterium]|nr:CDP-glucose 4,6-dehydratase [Actinomycetes bacterium]